MLSVLESSNRRRHVWPDSVHEFDKRSTGMKLKALYLWAPLPLGSQLTFFLVAVLCFFQPYHKHSRRQAKTALMNLILSEVGDVRAVYDVSESATKRTSKVDLAEAAGSTGVGAILGVGISGLVQVSRPLGPAARVGRCGELSSGQVDPEHSFAPKRED